MALDWFKKVEASKGLFAVERISLVYNAITTLLIVLLFSRMDHPVTMLIERVGIVAITFSLLRCFFFQAAYQSPFGIETSFRMCMSLLRLFSFSALWLHLFLQVQTLSQRTKLLRMPLKKKTQAV